VDSKRIEELQSGKIPLVVGRNDAPVRLGCRGDDHVERATWPAFGGTFGHQPCPNQTRIFVEGKDPPSEQRLRSFGTANQAANWARFFPAGFCSNPRRISAMVKAEITRSVSACSDIHDTSKAEGLGRVTLLKMLVSSK
jgi:hypothetical protein